MHEAPGQEVESEDQQQDGCAGEARSRQLAQTPHALQGVHAHRHDDRSVGLALSFERYRHEVQALGSVREGDQLALADRLLAQAQRLCGRWCRAARDLGARAPGAGRDGDRLYGRNRLAIVAQQVDQLLGGRQARVLAQVRRHAQRHGRSRVDGLGFDGTEDDPGLQVRAQADDERHHQCGGDAETRPEGGHRHLRYRGAGPGRHVRRGVAVLPAVQGDCHGGRR